MTDDPKFPGLPESYPASVPLPDSISMSLWEAALWRAFGRLDHSGFLCRRSFDQGTVKLPDEAEDDHAMRVEMHRRFDSAEAEILTLLAAGQVQAEGNPPLRRNTGELVDTADPVERGTIPSSAFRNEGLAISPDGRLKKRRLSLLVEILDFPHLRGTSADPTIPLYYNVMIRTNELRTIWDPPGNLPDLEQADTVLGHQRLAETAKDLVKGHVPKVELENWYARHVAEHRPAGTQPSRDASRDAANSHFEEYKPVPHARIRSLRGASPTPPSWRLGGRPKQGGNLDE